MEYKILSADTPEELVAKVLAATAENWRPTGGLTTAPSTTTIVLGSRPMTYVNTVSFHQAMVRSNTTLS